MRTWVIRFIKVLLLTELTYLALINVTLNLPLTQTVVNRIQPEKFSVTWADAWSFYPFRVHARTIFTNGQSGSQQWQARASSASASISLVSLLWRTVQLKNITARDVAYYQRPRPSPDKDYSDIRDHFPPIDGRTLEVSDVAGKGTKKGKKAWHINISNIYAEGRHELWLYQVRAAFDGALQTDLSFRTQGGAFSLKNGKVDIDLQTLMLNDDQKVLHEGALKGEVEFLPFVPRENKGMQVLKFLNVNAEIHTETESLTFLNPYLANFEGMEVEGAGLLKGQLHMQQGELLDDTNISVAARKLSLDMFDLHVKGDGNIDIQAVDQEESTDVTVTFSSLDAYAGKREAVLFSGDGLTVKAQSNRSILPESERPFQLKRLAMSIPSVEAPDISAFQLFLPSKLPVELFGGAGNLQGKLNLTTSGFKGNLRLNSAAADIGIKAYRFTSNLDMALMADSPALMSGVDISGTYVHLHGARVSSDSGESSESWHARVDIDNGKLKLLPPEGLAGEAGFRDLYQGLKGNEIAALIDSDKDDIQITASISDLSWLNVLLNNRLGLAINGSGEVSANIILSKGWPAPGTKMEIHPQALGVEVLDYIAEGEGEVTLLVEEGGENPDASISIILDEGIMRRKDEKQAFIEKVAIRLQALARSITFDGKGRDMDLHLRIPSAKVRDMAIYNQYLPEQAPIELTGGTAQLSADIKLTPDSAKGHVQLHTNGLSASVDQQQIEGEITTDITLVDGVPENMDFDISGSAVTLDKVRIAGAEKSHDDEDWSARFELKKAHAVWKRPISIDIEADLQMTDSKPIVAVIANQRGKHGWLEKALVIDDVNGDAELHMDSKHILVPYAYAASDKIDIGVKGVITADERDGVFYVRFRKLDGILKINNGKRNLDVLNAKEKFEAYDSEEVLLKIQYNNASM